MASVAYLDTHAVVWLYAGQDERFPVAAKRVIDESDVLISPMALLELQYLVEIERFTDPVEKVVENLRLSIGLRLCDLPFSKVAVGALQQDWTRDPFDRLIVSQAAVRRSNLITKDRLIHDHYDAAVWSH